MPPQNHQLSSYAYERFREQISAGVALCSDGQVMLLADQLNDSVRRRRAGLGERSFMLTSPDGRGSSLGQR